MAILSVKDPERNGVESMVIRRGDIFYADLRPVVGSEQGGVRPVLVKDSVVLLEQLRTIDKTRLKDKVCHLDHQILVKIDKALEISLELYT